MFAPTSAGQSLGVGIRPLSSKNGKEWPPTNAFAPTHIYIVYSCLLLAIENGKLTRCVCAVNQDKEPMGDILIYQTDDGQTRLEVLIGDDTVWLSLNQISDLFDRDKSVISRHIKNIFDEQELEPNSVVANFATTAQTARFTKSSISTLTSSLASDTVSNPYEEPSSDDGQPKDFVNSS